jgi:hypothetical protein
MYTLQEKTRPTRYTFSTLSSRMVQDHTYLTWSTYSNLLQNHQQIWTDPLPRQEGLPTQSTTRWLIDPRVHTQLLSHNSQWSSGENLGFYWQPTTRLTRPINTSMRLVRSILAHGGQPIGPWPTQVGAIAMEVLAFHIPLPNLPNQRSPFST